MRELNGAAAYARSTNLATNGCEEARRHLREKQIIFRPTCLTIAPSYVRQLRKSLNLVAPSRVSTWLLLDIGIPQSQRTRAWCQTRFLLWCRVLSRSGALAALSSSRTDFLSLRLTDRLLLPPSTPSFPPPPDRRDDNHHHCIKQMSVVARGSQTIFPSPIAWVCFVALPFNLRRVPNAAF